MTIVLNMYDTYKCLLGTEQHDLALFANRYELRTFGVASKLLKGALGATATFDLGNTIDKLRAIGPQVFEDSFRPQQADGFRHASCQIIASQEKFAQIR